MKTAIWIVRFIFMVSFTVVGVAVSPSNPFNGAAIAFCASSVLVLLEYYFARQLALLFPSVILGSIAGIFSAFIVVRTFYMLPYVKDYVFLPEANLFMMVACVFVYVAIACIFRTKDDIKIVIPYVEFARQYKGLRPAILDTSALIDGRIRDIATTGFMQMPMIVPGFVVDELHKLADSSDHLKRKRGQRGLDILGKMRQDKRIDLSIEREDATRSRTVDDKLVEMAKNMNGMLVTTDFSLNKIARINNVPVLNVNDLANAMKPAIIPGEHITIKLIRPGENPDQGVGFTDDGSMVVVENGRHLIGETVRIEVTSTLQTSAGRIIFGKQAKDDRERR